MTKIIWTEKTWNPIIGCRKISPGCLNCFAERMARRLSKMRPELAYENVIGNDGKWNGDIGFVAAQLEKPLKRRKPTMYFVSSMGDLFHHGTPKEALDVVFNVIDKCPQHIFQILTKRPLHMASYMRRRYRLHIPKNVWAGTTVENEDAIEDRMPHLLMTPAIVRFVSVEPMLSNVNLFPYLDSIDWVICGAESGPGMRWCKLHWIRNLRDQCVEAGVPFMLKQMHRDGPGPKQFEIVKEPWLDGRQWLEMPEDC